MNLRKFIGFSMISLPFAVVLIAEAIMSGWLHVIIAVVLTLVFVGLIVFGSYLASEQKRKKL